MPNIINPTSTYTDAQGLGALRRGAREHSPEALTAVAQQFEAMFIKMLLKGARDSALAEDVLGGDKNDIYNDMHDQQMAQQLAQRGIGIADMLVRQLSGALNNPAAPASPHKLPGNLPGTLPAAAPRAAQIDTHV